MTAQQETELMRIVKEGHIRIDLVDALRKLIDERDSPTLSRIAELLDGCSDPDDGNNYVTQAYRLAAGLPELAETSDYR